MLVDKTEGVRESCIKLQRTTEARQCVAGLENLIGYYVKPKFKGNSKMLRMSEPWGAL